MLHPPPPPKKKKNKPNNSIWMSSTLVFSETFHCDGSHLTIRHIVTSTWPVCWSHSKEIPFKAIPNVSVSGDTNYSNSTVHSDFLQDKNSQLWHTLQSLNSQLWHTLQSFKTVNCDIHCSHSKQSTVTYTAVTQNSQLWHTLQSFKTVNCDIHCSHSKQQTLWSGNIPYCCSSSHQSQFVAIHYNLMSQYIFTLYHSLRPVNQ
jgi:hypothetical protein